MKQALENCHSNQRHIVSGIYADEKFRLKEFKEAAKYYS
jgi:hypothetical protein